MLLWLLLAAVGPVEVETPAFEGNWVAPPARFEVDASVLEARVIDMADMIEAPAKVQQHLDKRYVFWTRRDDGSHPHRYRILPGETSVMAPPVFVGAGDMLSYGKVNVVADLGVGLWATALPIDWDGDGDWDLVYSCDDKPQGGTYLYEQVQANVFRLVKRLGEGLKSPSLADMNGDGKADLVLGGVRWYDDIHANGFSKPVEGPLERPEGGKIRGLMARQVDWDGDGVLDLLQGAGFWDDYGWDRGYDDRGIWTRGPLHGHVYFAKNTGTNTEPEYAEPEILRANDSPIDVYGAPCPCPGDYDGDGDLDLICGEFRDTLTYFENVGRPGVPRLAEPRKVLGPRDVLHVELCMIQPFPCDWNGDGRMDLIIGQEDGRVSVHLNRGMEMGAPQFTEDHFLQERNPPIKSGALVTPWFDASTRDIYCGNTAGYIELFQWLRDSYREGKRLRNAQGDFRIMAGYNGSVQGPAEEKWGYTVPTLGDLTNDGAADIVYNSILGRLEFVERMDSHGRTGPRQFVPVDWPEEPPYPAWNWWQPAENELVVQWRTRPLVHDWDKDGLQDIIAVDHEGYLAWYRRGETMLEPGKRVFLNEEGGPLRLNEREGGGSGRAKIHLADWDGDGDLDLIRNTESAGWFENAGENRFVWRGDFPCGRKLAGHTTCPQAVDWFASSKLDLIIGAEDGHIYCYHRAALEEPGKVDAVAVE